MNEASGIFQMFGILTDVATIGEDGVIEYLEEVPIASLHMPKGQSTYSMGKARKICFIRGSSN